MNTETIRLFFQVFFYFACSFLLFWKFKKIVKVLTNELIHVRYKISLINLWIESQTKDQIIRHSDIKALTYRVGAVNNEVNKMKVTVNNIEDFLSPKGKS